MEMVLYVLGSIYVLLLNITVCTRDVEPAYCQSKPLNRVISFGKRFDGYPAIPDIKEIWLLLPQ